MSKESKQTPIPMDETWTQIIDQLSQHTELITKQLKVAKKEFPALAWAFHLTLMYAGFLERRVRGLSRHVSSMIGDEIWRLNGIDCRLTPDPCPGRPIPEWLQKAIDAMKGEEDKEGSIPIFLGEIRTCDDIQQDYQEALDCVSKFAQQESLTPEEIEQWIKCINDLRKYMDELLENDCIQENLVMRRAEPQPV